LTPSFDNFAGDLLDFEDAGLSPRLSGLFKEWPGDETPLLFEYFHWFSGVVGTEEAEESKVRAGDFAKSEYLLCSKGMSLGFLNKYDSPSDCWPGLSFDIPADLLLDENGLYHLEGDLLGDGITDGSSAMELKLYELLLRLLDELDRKILSSTGQEKVSPANLVFLGDKTELESVKAVL
jgi:hypothetical protein